MCFLFKAIYIIAIVNRCNMIKKLDYHDFILEALKLENLVIHF